MTDNEIIKALWCHADEDLETCLHCALFNVDGCAYKLAKNSLDLINRQKAEIDDLEKELAINKGAMRAYREAFEKAHDEAVADFSHFLIDKAKDGSIDICDLPDLVAEWRSKLPQSAELTVPSRKEPDEAWLMERFMKVE